MPNDMVARRGVVWFGRNATVLCTCTTEDLMAHNAHGPRGGERACLRGYWDGGDHVCTRKGRRAVCGRRSSVAHGALSRHGCWRGWHGSCVWSSGWKCLSLVHVVAVGCWLAPRHAG